MIEGGCQCGRVRYRVERAAVRAYVCHCSECRRQSASAFAVSVPVRAAEVSVTGETAIYERAAYSGATTHCCFCPSCGVRLYHQSAASPEVMTFKAGTLDKPEGLRPVAHIWTRSKLPWVVVELDVEQFDTQPENLAAWRAPLLD